MATNWRNIVAKCNFLVASLYNVNDAAHCQGFWYFTPSQSCEIHKNTQNTAKFGRNPINYMSVQHMWNFSQLLGLFTCCKLLNLSWNFVTEMCKQRPETLKLPGVDYVAKNWALAMMSKALPLGQFWNVLLLKEQMMAAVKKTLKMLVWSAQNQSISNKVFPENNHKIGFFYRLIFSWVWPENSCEIGRFFLEFAPKNPTKFDFFSATYQKPCIEWYDPSDLKISWIEVGINLEVNRLCLCDLAHFLWWKQSRIRWNVCFNFTLLI